MTLSIGSKVTVNGGAPGTPITLNPTCEATPVMIVVTAEDNMTTTSYLINAYQPLPNPEPTSGIAKVGVVTMLFDAKFDRTEEDNLVGQLATAALIPHELIMIQTLVSTSDGTFVLALILSPPCGYPLYHHDVVAMLTNISGWFQFHVAGVYSNITTYHETLSDLPYCPDKTTGKTVYGAVCDLPPPPAQKKLSAEQAVAVTTGVLIFILIVILTLDSFYRKSHKQHNHKESNEVELRQHMQKKESETKTSTSMEGPSSPSITTGDDA